MLIRIIYIFFEQRKHQNVCISCFVTPGITLSLSVCKIICYFSAEWMRSVVS